jgi:DNA polymerase-3 subunit alpha
MNAMTKILPNRPGFTLADAEKIADFMALIDSKSHLKEVFTIAKKLEGCVRHVSVHACAVIIGRDDLTQNTPLQWAPGADEIKITQFPYQQLEKIGLLKMDFLGLKNLSIIEKAVANIERTTGKKLDLSTIALDDSKTFELFAKGDTTGVFQFESSGMRRYLRELCPTEFEDLVAMNALYRPGPMEFIPKYIEGKRKSDSVKYLHPVLEPILKKTYGIAVYQEQIQRIVQEFAGFSLGEGYLLIKAVAKKIASLLKKQREKFFEMAQKKGHSKKVAEKIFDFIEPFANYGFNRSHAVCYARIAYETAYLRANFPVEFMAAMMTTDRNNTDRIVLEMNECSAMEIEVLPPSINESGAHFTVVFNKIDDAQMKITGEEKVNKKIRFGLTAIKGLGEETVDQIILERNKKKFTDLADFARRVPQKLLNKKTLEALAFSGGFDEFGDRKAIVDSLDDLSRFAKEFQDKSEAGQMGLFGGIDDAAIEFSLQKTVATKEDILRWERESLGLFVSDHPCKGLQKYFEKYGKLIGKLTVDDVEQKRTIHGIVSSVRKIMTRAGKPMAILEIEDTSGKIEGAIFPQIFDRIPQKALEIDVFIRIRGKVSERDGVLNIIVDEIKVGNLVEAHKTAALFKEEEELSNKVNFNIFTINIPQGTTREKVKKLKDFLLTKKSEKGIIVEIVLGEKKVQVPFTVEVDKELKIEVKNLG